MTARQCYGCGATHTPLTEYWFYKWDEFTTVGGGYFTLCRRCLDFYPYDVGDDMPDEDSNDFDAWAEAHGDY